MSAAEAIVVVGLAFGDCGKGSIVDFLSRERFESTGDAPLIVRFNGGPQAGHNVVSPAAASASTPALEARHHTFAQFGSGTFVPGARTLLSHFMLIEPYAMINEAAHLHSLGVADAFERMLIDENCRIITPPQQAANRLRELARAEAHGTCGAGVGEAMEDSLKHPELVLRAYELGERSTVAAKLRAARDLKLEQLRGVISSLGNAPRARRPITTLVDPAWIDVAVDNYAWLAERVRLLDERGMRAAIRDSRSIIFEGAQGVLLDENYGFHPHTTWSTTTFANADSLLDEAGFSGERVRLGVLRSYFTRHGAGPFVTEDPGLVERLPEPHNDARGWQGCFRVGAFDAVAARYALAACGGVDGLALTHLDRLGATPPRLCTAYECDDQVMRDIPLRRSPDLAHQAQLTRQLRCCRPVFSSIDSRSDDCFIETVERELRVHVTLTSAGPSAGEKRRRGVGR